MVDKHIENDPYKEYMCNQCGNIYQQAGYKIVQVPIPGASTSSAVKEEFSIVTQELVGPSKILEKEVEVQVSCPTLTDSATQTIP